MDEMITGRLKRKAGSHPNTRLVRRQIPNTIATMETYAPAHYQLGRALRRLGQDEAARAAFTRAYSLNPSLIPPAGIR
jgi:hypothetical protein